MEQFFRIQMAAQQARRRVASVGVFRNPRGRVFAGDNVPNG